MRVWVFVEGPSDQLALDALWADWQASLRLRRHSIGVVHLTDKSRYLRKIGPRAAEKLAGSPDDIVIGLPDLYPTAPYQTTEFRHASLVDLQRVQEEQVRAALRDVYGMSAGDIDSCVARFLGTALKHDLEMLLLAAKNELRSYLRTADRLDDSWRKPVEEQNQERPPKRVVEELFRTRSAKKKAYRDTKDAPAVLRRVGNIRTILYDGTRQIQCPVFKRMLDWVGDKTGVRAYDEKE